MSGRSAAGNRTGANRGAEARAMAAVLAVAAALAGCGASSTPHASIARSGGATGNRRPSRRRARLTSSADVSCRRAAAGGGAAPGARTGAIPLPAAPDGIALTPDGRIAFVALASGPPRVAVLAVRAAAASATMPVRLLRTIPVPATPSGLAVTPDGRHLLGAAGRGIDVVDVARAITGQRGATLGLLQAPAAVTGPGPGAAEVTASADSRFAFVTLEGAGRVAVFDLRAAAAGGFSGAAGYRGSIPVGAGALGIAPSPGSRRRLYVASESGRAPGARRAGVLTVLDTAAAIADPARAILARIAAPCAPVRVAAAGGRVWVTARAGNALLGFSAAALTRSPARALASVTRVGGAPLGLGVSGDLAVVADSDLSGGHRTRSAVSLLRLGPGDPVVIGTVQSIDQADAVALATDPGGGAVTALVTDSGAARVLTLRLSGPGSGP